jgi:hypothetical protein
MQNAASNEHYLDMVGVTGSRVHTGKSPAISQKLYRKILV